MTFPYVEQQTVWGMDFPFWIDNYRSEDWYGLAGVRRLHSCDQAEALRLHDNFDPTMRSLIRPGDLVLDCGANEGWTTVLFALRAGAGGKVIAIECNRANVERLHRNLALNHLQSSVTVEHAFIDEVGGGAWRMSASDSECFHRPFPWQQASPSDADAVRVVTLDDYLEHQPSVVKIDVEGFEVRALLGGQKLLRTKPRLEVEIHLGDVDMRKHGNTPEQLWQLLNDYGLTCRGDYGVHLKSAAEIRQGCLWCY